MALNIVIDLHCQPKRGLGNGDTDAGTRALLGLLRARDIAAHVRQSAAKDGRDPATASAKLMTVGPEGLRSERSVSLPQLEQEAAGLDAIAADCATCPVNPGGRPGGCAGSVSYPISLSGEEWLLGRIQPPDTVGGFLLLKAIHDFKYDGSAVKSYRERKLFESETALSHPLPANKFGVTAVNGDQLFHALLGVGPKLNPWHLGMFLCWLGALGVDGYVPTTLDQFEMLVQLPPADRPKRTRPNLGDPHPDPGIRAVQGLLHRMAVAWAHDRPLIVDA